jgi:hypothetical protein
MKLEPIQYLLVALFGRLIAFKFSLVGGGSAMLQ